MDYSFKVGNISAYTLSSYTITFKGSATVIKASATMSGTTVTVSLTGAEVTSLGSIAFLQMKATTSASVSLRTQILKINPAVAIISQELIFSVVESGGTTDYTDLSNKPSIGGVTLVGNKTLDDLGAYTQAEVDALIEEHNEDADAHIETRSHVGQIIMSTTLNTMAKVIALYGGTTWAAIEGRFLLGASSSYAVNTTGGSATNSHTHSVTASGTVGNHKLTTSEMPSHTHGSGTLKFATVANCSTGSTTTNAVAAAWTGNYEGILSGNTASTGGGGNHNHGFTGSAVTSGGASNTNNMPPYKAVYIWERTA